MNYPALILLIWVIVSADRYIEYRQECSQARVKSDITTDGQIILFSMLWPIVMPVRICVFAFRTVRGTI